MYINGKNHWRVKLVVGGLFFVLTIIPVGSVWAELGKGTKIATPVVVDGIVKLVATLQDSPAFTGVEWRLYRLGHPAHPVKVIHRHTAMVNLKPGNYRAVAKLKSTRRSRAFSIKSSITKEVIIPMD